MGRSEWKENNLESNKYKMKERNRENRKLILWVILSLLLGILILFFFISTLEEQHFKIYNNESGELVEVKDNIIEWCYDDNDCGKIKIGEKSWGIEWLDRNCNCIRICEYIFNSSKREKFKVEDAEKFIDSTYEGLIWFTIDEEGNEIIEYYQGNVELIEKCNPCQEYFCEEKYIVEVWNQIK